MNAGSSMEGGGVAAGESEAEANLALMARNGITRVTAYQYRVDGYSYTNLGDAMAQVARSSRGRAQDAAGPAG